MFERKKLIRSLITIIFASTFLLTLANFSIAFTDGDAAIDGLGQISGGVPVYTTSSSENSPDSIGLSSPAYVAIDSIGHRLFVSDSSNNRVLVFNLSTSNYITDYSADYVLGQSTFSGSGSATTQSGLYGPQGLAYYNNILYVADNYNNRVMVYDVTSITNGENAAYVLGQTNFTSSTGATTQAGLNSPFDVTIDTSSSVLYVADNNNYRVVTYDVTAVVNGENAVNVLGQANFTSATYNYPPTQASLMTPQGVEFDNTNNTLYISDSGNARVIVHDFDLTPISDNRAANNVLGQTIFTTNNTGTTQSTFGFSSPKGISYSSNTLYVSDAGNNRILTFDVTAISDGENATKVLGQADFISSSSATTQAGLYGPRGLAVSSDRLFVADVSSNRVIAYDITSISDGEAAVNLLGHLNLAGTDVVYTSGVANNRPNNQGITGLQGCTVDPANNRLFITDGDAISTRQRVLSFGLNTSTKSLSDYSADNVLGQTSMTAAVSSNYNPQAYTLYDPEDMVFDPVTKYLFVSEAQDFGRLLVYDLSSGISDGMSATYVLGQANLTTWFDSTVDAAALSNPKGMDIATIGGVKYLFVADADYHRVVIYDIDTIVNDENAVKVIGQTAFTNNSSGTTQSTLSAPTDVEVDDSGTTKYLYVSDFGNNRVMVYDVTNVAGMSNGPNATAVIGQANYTSNTSGTTSATLSSPWGLDMETSSGNLFVSDNANNRVLTFNVSTLAEFSEVATTVLGQANFTSSSAATASTGLSGPAGICRNSSNGELYVADAGNNRYMVFDTTSNSAPSISTTMTHSQQSDDGFVNIVYTLTDADTETDIALDAYEYSVDNAAWSTMTAASADGAHSGVSSLTGASGGTSNTFVWDACTDLSVYDADVWVRFTPNDGTTAGSSAASTASLAVDCGLPTLSSITAAQNSGADTVAIGYTSADDTATDLTVAIDISEDGGSSWTVTDTSVTGAVGASQSTGASQTITWDAGTDFASQDQSDIQVRVRATDKYQNVSTNYASSNFALDTLAPTGLAWVPSNFNTTTSSLTIAWAQVTETNFSTYDLWYGQIAADVESRSGSATQSTIASKTTLTDLISNLSAGTGYYFKIWASDSFSHEAAVSSTLNLTTTGSGSQGGFSVQALYSNSTAKTSTNTKESEPEEEVKNEESTEEPIIESKIEEKEPSPLDVLTEEQIDEAVEAVTEVIAVIITTPPPKPNPVPQVPSVQQPVGTVTEQIEVQQTRSEVKKTVVAALESISAGNADKEEGKKFIEEAEKVVEKQINNVQKGKLKSFRIKTAGDEFEIKEDTKIIVDLTRSSVSDEEKKANEKDNIVVVTPSTTINDTSILFALQKEIPLEAIIEKDYDDDGFTIDEEIYFGFNPEKKDPVSKFEVPHIPDFNYEEFVASKAGFKVVGPAGAKVKMLAVPLENFDKYMEEKNKRFSFFSTSLFASVLGNNDKESVSTDLGAIELGSTTIDERHKGFIVSETPLPAGSYNLMIQDEKGVIFSFYKINVDEDLDKIEPEINIDQYLFTKLPPAICDNTRVYGMMVDRIATDSAKKYLDNLCSEGNDEIFEPLKLTGTAEPGSAVFLTWKSVVLSSVVIADASGGRFEIAVPENEKGDHEAIAYIQDSKGRTSSVRKITFRR